MNETTSATTDAQDISSSLRLRILNSAIVALVVMFGTASCTSNPPATDEQGALAEALEAQSSHLSSEVGFPGVTLTVLIDGQPGQLGLFKTPKTESSTLDLQWAVEVLNFSCPECSEGTQLEVDTVVFVDRFETSPAHATVATVEVAQDSLSPFEFDSEPVALNLDPDRSHCLVLLSTIRLLQDGEPAGTVNIESAYQVGTADDTACSLRSQAGESSDWDEERPEGSFACTFGRFLRDTEDSEIRAEVNSCDSAQLLVAVPLDAGGVPAPCCFHWYGVPAAQKGTILTRPIVDLEPGSWRSILVPDPPTGATYEGPYIVAGWPGIVRSG